MSVNKASQQDVLAAKLFFTAAFPAMRVPLEEDPKQAAKFRDLNTVVQFSAEDDENPVACHIVFLSEEEAAKTEEGKRFKVYEGKYEGDLPVIDMAFPSIKSLLGVFKGNTPLDMLGIVKPLLKNMFKKGTFRFLFLMLNLMKMMPDYVPDASDPWGQYLKVKMSLYMITRAMSRANKLGWEPMTKWTEKQTDRIYQFRVGATRDKDGNELYPEIAAYLRVKAGKTKAGRGEYTRKRPFVLLDFPNPDGCIAVLSGRYEFVQAVEHKCVTVIGSGDSYAVQFNNIMNALQAMLVPEPKN